MTKIFITGAAGTLGTALMAELHDTGAEIVAGVHSPNKAHTLNELGVEARVFDFGDIGSMTNAMEGCQRMFLVLPLHEKMTRYGHLAVQAAKQAGIEYIVRSSGYAASSDAHWRLGREHGMVDQFVEDSGIPFTVLRPNSFMQNFSGPYAAMLREGIIAMPEDLAKVSYIDVRDIAACAARLLLDSTGHENSMYALTGPQGLSLADVASVIGEAAGRKIAYTPIDEDAFIATMQGFGIPAWNIDMLVSLTRVVKLGMIGNVTKAVEHLTGKPARTFTDFATEHAAVWR